MPGVTAETLALVKQWEGFRPTAYPDPGSANGEPWTIGYGQTTMLGRKVRKSDTISEASAAAWLGQELTRIGAEVDRLVKVPLTGNQRGALMSFVYNVGEGAFAKSTLLKKLNKGQYEAVPAELARWNKNDGKVMPGLVNRRAAEAGLWARGAHVASNTVDAKPAAPPIVDKETVSWGAGIVGTLGALFAGSGPVQYALAAVIVVAFGIGAYLFISKRMFPR